MTASDQGRPARVLLIVGGGIAAYKAPALVRAMRARGVEVQVVMTDAAAAFVTELSLSTVSGRAVRRSLLDPAQEGTVGHIELADWPDLVVVAPGTANLMSRAASGGASDLASTVLLATRAPVMWAPAMNTNMWTHPATAANVSTLSGFGHLMVGPASGELACGWQGVGAMVDVEPLCDAVMAQLGDRGIAGHGLEGQTVLVSAGPTRAYIDPVRFMTNASTGQMGFALAEEAARRGARVVLVAGPVERPTPPGVERVDVTTAEEMYAALRTVCEAGPVDLLAMVAAVSDVRVAAPRAQKASKDSLLADLGGVAWAAERDLLASLMETYRGRIPALGFAAQTVAAEEDEAATLQRLGARKMAAKGVDALFVNRVGVPGVGFESDTNAGWLMFAAEGPSSTASTMDAFEAPSQSKSSLAGWILDHLIAREMVGFSG